MITRENLLNTIVEFFVIAGFYADEVEKEMSVKTDEELMSIFEEYHMTVI